MKIGSNGNMKGSFGIPPALREAEERIKQAREQGEFRPDFESDPSEQEEQEEQGEEESAQHQEEALVIKNPLEVLKSSFGIVLEDEDFHKILFRGFVEKDIEAVPSIRGSKPLIATIKSLNGQEYDLVDELLAEDIRDVRMTNDGYSTRRNMWILSFAIPKLQGKSYVSPVLMKDQEGKDVLDAKATAKKRRAKLATLNAAVLTRLMKIHGQLTLAINAIMEDPEADFLKKP
jgi:hypothetical protein